MPVAVEWTPRGRDTLNAHMDRYREVWMRRMLHREARMVDMQIMAALQNGTAFFASTSLIAIGGALSLMRSTDDILAVMAALPLSVPGSRAQWEAKTIGPRHHLRLCVLQVRLVVPALQLRRDPARRDAVLGRRETPEAAAHIRRTARLFQSAGPPLQPRPTRLLPRARLSRLVRRAFVLIASTAAVIVVMWRRQFASEARLAVMED